MTTISNVTPAALMAAELIDATYSRCMRKAGLPISDDNAGTVERIAQIIDRETGASEMLEALEAIAKNVSYVYCTLCTATKAEGHRQHCPMIAAEAAIRKAKGER